MERLRKTCNRNVARSATHARTHLKMSNAPWRHWIPGVLSKCQVIELCELDLIRSVDEPEKVVAESSLDLRLSDEVYRLTKGSVKPFSHAPYFDTLRRAQLIEEVQPEGNSFTLKKLNTYLVKSREKLSAKLLGTRIFGQATAKSSIGRLDVLVRIIVDGMDGYDYYNPTRSSEGEIFAEVTPIGFDVRIKPDITLAQLRLFYGEPRSAEIRGEEVFRTCILHPNSDYACSQTTHLHDGLLSVNLEPLTIAQQQVSAFEGQPKEESPPLDLWREREEANKPNPRKYFKALKAEDEKIVLEPSSFYILRSRERLSLPGSIAVYIRAIDETLGEMRIHYAGFAHPYFGRERTDDAQGTPLIFEVRGHDFPAILMQEEKMAKLIFYRMSEPASKPEQSGSEYNNQELKLSNIFQDFESAGDR